MNKIQLILFALVISLCSCNNIDKLKKTGEIIKEIDRKKDGSFSFKASIENNVSHLSVVLKHSKYQAYYTGSLYEIIMELHKNKIKYDDYEIKDPAGKVVWRVNDSEIKNITATLEQSKKLIHILERKEYDKFLTYANFKTLGISDSTFLERIKPNPIYPNTSYKGFSVIEQEINGEKKEFLYIFFMNDEKKENLIVLSPEDQLVYGLEY